MIKIKLSTILFIIAIIASNANAVFCVDFATLNVYEQMTNSKYTQGDNEIGNEIRNITNTIKSEIKQIENNNKTLLKNLKRAKEAESILALKKSFLLKQNNELQSINNNIKAN
ncbi:MULTISPECIES: hypothetical protein [Helicobacter]|uniref:Periplasmic protein n=1 Tax=Helicobacter fennelliae TaxID=215 RepID=A0A2X3B0T4_9HELI|nr:MULTISPECIES: hypothetical protein [Helicobacter]BAM12561.1 hypothetical protein HCN_1354 [Helicobacter cinaedi PAGU611]SQB98788.1 Uncharacterised protein [Helicobacter fennelliae]STQ83962.1 Uncharacterised protein [Helicobacter fennelliae]